MGLEIIPLLPLVNEVFAEIGGSSKHITFLVRDVVSCWCPFDFVCSMTSLCSIVPVCPSLSPPTLFGIYLSKPTSSLHAVRFCTLESQRSSRQVIRLS